MACGVGAGEETWGELQAHKKARKPKSRIMVASRTFFIMFKEISCELIKSTRNDGETNIPHQC